MVVFGWLGFGVFWLLLAFEPLSRFTWVLENILLVGFTAVFLLSYRWITWSAITSAAVLAFLVLHAVGAHFSYALVPYDAVSRDVLGFSVNEIFGWERNHFDRAVHYAYGLLMSIPLLEYCRHKALPYGAVLTVAVVMCTSLIFELLEWGAALVFAEGGDMAFVGAQGDVWDAHMDMFLAIVGSVMTCSVTVLPTARQKWRGSNPAGKVELPLGV